MYQTPQSSRTQNNFHSLGLEICIHSIPIPHLSCPTQSNLHAEIISLSLAIICLSIISVDAFLHFCTYLVGCCYRWRVIYSSTFSEWEIVCVCDDRALLPFGRSGSSNNNKTSWIQKTNKKPPKRNAEKWCAAHKIKLHTHGLKWATTSVHYTWSTLPNLQRTKQRQEKRTKQRKKKSK